MYYYQIFIKIFTFGFQIWIYSTTKEYSLRGRTLILATLVLSHLYSCCIEIWANNSMSVCPKTLPRCLSLNHL